MWYTIKVKNDKTTFTSMPAKLVNYYFRHSLPALLDYKYCTNRHSNRNHTATVF